MDNKERIAVLSAFLECPTDVAEKLSAKMTYKSFNHREILVHQGDINDQLWLILDGNTQLQAIGYGGQITMLTSQGPGEICGAFPREAISSCDIKTYGKLSTLQISTVNLIVLLNENPSLGRGLSKIFGNQYNAVIGRLAMHVTLTAKGRVYSEILRLSKGKNYIRPNPIIAAIALSAQTTRETASRAISDLSRRGIIKRNSNRLEIISRNILEELVV